MKRFPPVVAALMVLALAGCKDPGNAQGDPASGFVRGAPDIVVKSVRTYAATDAVAGSSDEYYVIAFTFTNDQSMALAPQINHFALQDQQNRKFFGVESGNAALVSISNYGGVLKVGDSHDYTVGFRVPHDVTGTLFYDNTF